ncbi:MAG: AzlC family ABC transporter permease [Clostridium sp.]|nr:AzlC family ABC transporter permease [Clostridium sp.]
MIQDYKSGVRKGLPICLGYLSVSFTFGLLAVNGGLPVWMALLISVSNLTGAGQFAAVNLMIQGTSYIEIALTTLIINLRYTLMSISLSQKIKPEVPTKHRLLMGYGITDEIFSVASLEPGMVTFPFMMGLISISCVGWFGGTLLGALICSALPEILSSAMGIAIYGMFIAIVIPPLKQSRPILLIVLFAVAINLVFYYVPVFHVISTGFRVIITSLIAAGIGAILFPAKEDMEND